MFCQKCGHEIPDNARYCAFCGEKVSGNMGPGKKKEANPMDILQHKSTAQPQRSAPSQPQMSGSASKSGMDSSLIIKVAIGFVVVMIAISMLAK